MVTLSIGSEGVDCVGVAAGDTVTFTASADHADADPGTYFPVVRVTAQREGDAGTPFTRIQNLARVRVIVG